VLWLAAVAATLELRPFLRSLQRPIGALPIALVALAALGTLWSDAPWETRLHALGPAAKLLALPFLFYHFERSARGMWVFVAFLASCTLMTVASWIVVIDPSLSMKIPGEPTGHGIFVKNYIAQSQEFVLCTVVLAFPIITLFREGKIRQALLLTAVAANFVVNMVFVVVSRTALVTLPVMLAAFAMAHLKWRTNVLLYTATVVLGALAWTVSPQLQATTDRSRGITGSTRSTISRHRSGCGWNFGRSRCASLPRLRCWAMAPDRPRGFSNRLPSVPQARPVPR